MKTTRGSENKWILKKRRQFGVGKSGPNFHEGGSELDSLKENGIWLRENGQWSDEKGEKGCYGRRFSAKVGSRKVGMSIRCKDASSAHQARDGFHTLILYHSPEAGGAWIGFIQQTKQRQTFMLSALQISRVTFNSQAGYSLVHSTKRMIDLSLPKEISN